MTSSSALRPVGAKRQQVGIKTEYLKKFGSHKTKNQIYEVILILNLELLNSRELWEFNWTQGPSLKIKDYDSLTANTKPTGECFELLNHQ